MDNNLDALINKIGYEIVNEKILDKNQIDKMLGVLTNDGVYAWWVYAKSKNDIQEIKLMETLTPLFTFVKKLNYQNYEEYLQKLSQKLNNILFFREILEKILIYARYHAKAMGD